MRERERERKRERERDCKRVKCCPPFTLPFYQLVKMHKINHNMRVTVLENWHFCVGAVKSSMSKSINLGSNSSIENITVLFTPFGLLLDALIMYHARFC